LYQNNNWKEANFIHFSTC